MFMTQQFALAQAVTLKVQPAHLPLPAAAQPGGTSGPQSPPARPAACIGRHGQLSMAGFTCRAAGSVGLLHSTRTTASEANLMEGHAACVIAGQ